MARVLRPELSTRSISPSTIICNNPPTVNAAAEMPNRMTAIVSHCSAGDKLLFSPKPTDEMVITTMYGASSQPRPASR